MKSLFIRSLAIVAVLVGHSSTVSTEWIYEEAATKGGPEMKWASKCDFVPEEDCERLCLADADCINAVWVGGMCFLNPGSKTEGLRKSDSGKVLRCGFVFHRVI